MGTLGRRKKAAEEVVKVENEGKHAIDSPGMPKSAEMPPEVRRKGQALFQTLAKERTLFRDLRLIHTSLLGIST